MKARDDKIMCKPSCFDWICKREKQMKAEMKNEEVADHIGCFARMCKGNRKHKEVVVHSGCVDGVYNGDKIVKEEMKDKEITSKMGCFDQIPDDILLLILSRLDLKLVCQCLLVSKSFASLIYRIPTMKVSLPCTVQIHQRPFVSAILRKILRSTTEQIPDIINSSSNGNLKFYRSLEKFTELKSIHVKFNSPKITHYYSPTRLRLICRGHGSMVQSLVVMLPASIRKMSKRYRSGVRPINKENPIEFTGQCQRNDEHVDCLLYFAEWLVVLFLLIKCSRDSLERVAVSDCNRSRDEVFVLSHEQLVEWRKILCFRNSVTPKYSRLFMRPDLCLPVSRYVIKESLFMVMDLNDASYVEYDDAMTWKYCGEKKLLRETVTQLKGHEKVDDIWDILELNHSDFEQWWGSLEFDNSEDD